MESHLQYTDLFRAQRELICAGSVPAMNACRDEAASLLERQGFPTSKEERYKYISAAEAFAPNYGLNLRRLQPKFNPYETYRCNVPNLSTSLFFIVGDVPYAAPEASRTLLPEGAIVESFSRIAEERPALLAKYYNHAARVERGFRAQHDGVTLLNTMLSQDGLLIYLPAGAELKAPLQIVNVASSLGKTLSTVRVLIIAEEAARGAVLFCNHAGGETLTSQVVEIFAARGSHLDIFSIEETQKAETHFTTYYVEQAEESRVCYNGVTLTCGTSRTRLDVRLRGERATSQLNGAIIADDRQRVDNNILVEHLAPKCTSQMLYKYVLDGESMGAFAGKVYVAKDAQQTSSQQTNANLCASPTARAFSQPMLEIYADDVRCNHGSTVGKLDEAALFYMRQRGIPEAEARLLLQHAFINEVLQHVEIPYLYERLSHLVELRFRGELHQCRGCNIRR